MKTGHGSQFWLANGAGVLTKVAKMLTVPKPTGTKTLINVSHMETEGFEEYITAPLRDGAEADLTMNWEPGSVTDELLEDAVEDDQARDFEIIIPTSTAGVSRKYSGQLIVLDYSVTNERNDKRVGTLKVKWSGQITREDV
ncbi:MAG: phage tail tube protein [Allosphingosinicella sp.]